MHNHIYVLSIYPLQPLTNIIMDLEKLIGNDVTPDLIKWASECPNPQAIANQLAVALFIKEVTECNECGDEHVRPDLRIDESYFETGELICKSLS